MNSSGIHPQGDRVLIEVEDVTMDEGKSILIPDFVKEDHKRAQMAGVLVETGADAWSDYSKPFASIGQRIMYARHGGIEIICDG